MKIDQYIQKFKEGGEPGGFIWQKKDPNIDTSKLNPALTKFITGLPKNLQSEVLVTETYHSDVHKKNSRHYNNNAVDLKFSQNLYDWSLTPEGSSWRKQNNITLLDPNHGTAKHLHFSFGTGSENLEDVSGLYGPDEHSSQYHAHPEENWYAPTVAPDMPSMGGGMDFTTVKPTTTPTEVTPQKTPGQIKQEQLQAERTQLLEMTPQAALDMGYKKGGYLSYLQKGGYLSYLQKGGYNIETDLQEYGVNATPIVKGDLTNVERFQGYSGKGYGSKMQSVEDTINTHDWYFKTDEQKEKFRQSVTKKGGSKEVKAFQTAYNQELKNRLANSTLSEEDKLKIYNQSAFINKGVQRTDGKFGAFTSSRPILNFEPKEVNTSIPQILNPATPQEPTQQVPNNKLYQVKLFAEDMADGNRDFEQMNLNNYINRKTEEQGGLSDKDIQYLQGVVDKHNDNLEKRYNNEESKSNPKAQERLNKLRQYLETKEIKEEAPKQQNGGWLTNWYQTRVSQKDKK